MWDNMRESGTNGWGTVGVYQVLCASSADLTERDNDRFRTMAI
jgi:hypothetical protein